MSFPALSSITQKLFDLPEYAQRENNICSMVNFFPEAKRLMDAVALERIAEIGSEAGLNTGVLLNYVKQRGKKLVTVDPVKVPFPFSPEAETAFTFLQETSAEFLKRDIPAEVLFMDGDHNYETVLADLKKIHETRKKNRIKLLFLHDVSWPWARQDIYYDPQRIAHPHPYHAENRVSPYPDEKAPSLSPANYVTADHAGGAANGVLTAVEDFLTQYGASWRFQRIPVLYGIGILIALDNVPEEEQRKLLPLVDELASHNTLLSILELNRIENLCQYDTLLQKLKDAGDVWRKDQSYIKSVNEIMPGLAADIQQKQAEIDRLQQSLTEKSSAAETLSTQLQTSQAEQEKLRTAGEQLLAHLNCVNQTIEKQQTALSSLTETVSGQEKQLASAQDSLTREMAENGKLQTLRDQLEKDLNQCREDFAACRQKAADLNAANATLQTSQKELQAALRTKNAEIDQLQTLRDQLGKDLNQCREDLAACRQKAADLNAANATLQTSQKELQAALRTKDQALQEARKECDGLRNALWTKDQELRRRKLETPSGLRHIRQAAATGLLPYQLRNAGKLKEIARMISGGTVKLLSLDIFDTLLLREFRPELKRFADAARKLHQRHPEISTAAFCHARALAHQMAYQTCSVTEGCREASASTIFRIMAAILGAGENLIPELRNEELEYELKHLHLNLAIWKLVRLAHGKNIPVIAVSDMYWSGIELQKILDALLPEPGAISKIYSSADYGVSKLSGLLFDRVAREQQAEFPAILHAGDNLQSDFMVPFVRNGIQAYWLPRSNCYTRYCNFMQKHEKIKLQKRNILHGIR